MKDFALINAGRLPEYFNTLSNTEFKMLLFILFYLSSNDKTVYFNNVETREFLAEMGFKKTPERITTILGSMVRKKVLKREAQGAYSVIGNLFLPASSCDE